MSRCALVRFRCFSSALAALAFVLAGCSGDAKDGAGDRSSGAGGSGAGGSGATDSDGSPTGSAGSGPGVSSDAGSGGSGGGASAATYTAAQACQRFAQASCSKGLECGLVLAQTGSALICVQCDALSLGIIQQACEQDISGDKNAADVDRCLANLAAQPCAVACVNPEVDGCDVFAELEAGRSNTVVCDSRCVAAGR